MADNFTLDFQTLDIRTDLLDPSEFAEFCGKELQNQNRRLLRRLGSGRKANGQKLKRYEPSYRAQMKRGKIAGTRGRFGKDPSPVNLTVSGGFNNSRQVGLLRDGAKLVFVGSFQSDGSADSITYAQLAKWQLELRPGWFEFAQKDVDDINRRFAREFGKILKKLIDVKKLRGL